jgi:DNA-binding transcriptional LysR family regulator
MHRTILPHLPAVLAVAKRGGFSAAAQELGVTPSNVSHSVRFVEDRLGVALFTRTTRSVALSEEGRVFAAQIAPLMSEIGAVWEGVRSRRTKASGLLRLNIPRLVVPWVITPVLKVMAERFPDVTVEAFCDDAFTDIVGEGFDAGIRVGTLVAQNMVTVALVPAFRLLICASPAYLAKAGTPKTLADLQQHNCIQYRLSSVGGIYRWHVTQDGLETQVETHGTVIINDALQARDLALAGIGLTYAFEPVVADDLRKGRLVEVLAANSSSDAGLSLYFPASIAQAPKLRAFIETAKAVLHQ